MPLTALDPQTALIVIDLQKGIVGSQLIDPIAEIATQQILDLLARRSVTK